MEKAGQLCGSVRSPREGLGVKGGNKTGNVCSQTLYNRRARISLLRCRRQAHGWSCRRYNKGWAGEDRSSATVDHASSTQDTHKQHNAARRSGEHLIRHRTGTAGVRKRYFYGFIVWIPSDGNRTSLVSSRLRNTVGEKGREGKYRGQKQSARVGVIVRGFR